MLVALALYHSKLPLLIFYFNFSIFEVTVFYGWEKRSIVFLVAHGSIAISPFHHSMDEKFLFISRKWIKTLFEATFLKNPTNPFSIAMIILIFVANVISFEIKNVCVISDYLSCNTFICQMLDVDPWDMLVFMCKL